MSWMRFLIENGVMGAVGYAALLTAALLIAKRDSGPDGPLSLAMHLTGPGAGIAGWVIAVQNFN